MGSDRAQRRQGSWKTWESCPSKKATEKRNPISAQVPANYHTLQEKDGLVDSGLKAAGSSYKHRVLHSEGYKSKV